MRVLWVPEVRASIAGFRPWIEKEFGRCVSSSFSSSPLSWPPCGLWHQAPQFVNTCTRQSFRCIRVVAIVPYARPRAALLCMCRSSLTSSSPCVHLSVLFNGLPMDAASALQQLDDLTTNVAVGTARKFNGVSMDVFRRSAESRLQDMNPNRTAIYPRANDRPALDGRVFPFSATCGRDTKFLIGILTAPIPRW